MAAITALLGRLPPNERELKAGLRNAGKLIEIGMEFVPQSDTSRSTVLGVMVPTIKSVPPSLEHLNDLRAKAIGNGLPTDSIKRLARNEANRKLRWPRKPEKAVVAYRIATAFELDDTIETAEKAVGRFK